MTALAALPEGIRLELRRLEPDFDFIASAGVSILPALRELLAGDDELLALRAVHVASLVGGRHGASLVRDAARDSRASVRVGVAAALRRLPADAAEATAADLLSDTDPSVRRWAVRTAEHLGLTATSARLATMAREDPEVAVRDAAAAALVRIEHR